MENIFIWDKLYETGIPNVDTQHHRLVDLINQLGTLVTENTGGEADVINILDQLSDYARLHFTDEEKMMADIGIDPRHLQAHVNLHRDFLDYVTSTKNRYSSDISAIEETLLGYLAHWLMYHILTMDMEMSAQVKAIKSGMEPAEAYEQNTKEQDHALGPLLKALNNLYQLLSVRNRQLLDLNQSLEQKVAERTRQLTDANKQLEEISLTDALTNLPNRRHAMKTLSMYWKESLDQNRDLTCMMIDADHFKEVNDKYGHDAGDIVLQELARTLSNNVRTDDLVCRLGGDEFFVICPGTSLDGGLHLGEQLRKVIANLRVKTGDGYWNSSVSIGVATKTDDMADFEALIKLADRSVYLSKEDGKNCVRTINGNESTLKKVQ